MVRVMNYGALHTGTSSLKLLIFSFNHLSLYSVQTIYSLKELTHFIVYSIDNIILNTKPYWLYTYYILNIVFICINQTVKKGDTDLTQRA